LKMMRCPLGQRILHNTPPIATRIALYNRDSFDGMAADRHPSPPMIISDLESQILTLTSIEKAQVIQLLMGAIGQGSRGICKTPGVMGGDACLAHTRLPVWLFVDLRRQGSSDAELLELYPHLTAADLVNVWAYATAYPDEIETALQKQGFAIST
jgi:uncharacterized protein (DUF433 family)